MEKININKCIDNKDWKNVQKTSPEMDTWVLSREFRVYKDYTLNSYFEEINNSLRSGLTDNICMNDAINALDTLFQTMPKQATPKTDMEVYRGTLLTKELNDIITGKAKTDIYTEKGFVSTSKSKQIAKQFALGEDKVIMHITVPKGSKVIDDSILPSYIASKMSNEQEVLLPRNSQFKILSYNPKTRIVEAEFIGQAQPLEMPTYSKYSGYDILANLNKNALLPKEKFIINKEFNSID